MWILHSISFLWCTSYGNCPGENKSSNFIWLNLIQERLNIKQCWPAILINNHIWDRSLGICSWLDLVILQYFCWGQSFLSSCLLMQLFLSAKLSLEVLSVEMPGGCRSQGCHGYIHCLLMVPLLPHTHRLTMCLTVRLSNRVGSSITLLSWLKTLINRFFLYLGEKRRRTSLSPTTWTNPWYSSFSSCPVLSFILTRIWSPLITDGRFSAKPGTWNQKRGKLFEPSFLEECTN